MVVDAIARIVHQIFAAVWAGAVVYVTWAILPLARDGEFNAAPLEALSGRLTTLSRTSAVVLLLTGGHLAGSIYTFDGEGGPSLFASTRGQLVIAMVLLWLALAALVEVGAKRFETGLEAKKVREPARDALPVFRAASLVALGLLVVAGLLTTNALGRFV